MARTSRNHRLNCLKEKRSMKSKQSSIIENEEKDINFTSNGKDTLSPMPHGNRNMSSLMMATSLRSTNWDITFNTTLPPSILMPHFIKDNSGTGKRTTKHLLPTFDNPTNHCSTMSTSSYNSYTTADTLPSPQEMSRILHDPALTSLIYQRFVNWPSTRQLLQQYDFVSQTISTLEQQLEQHHMEREHLYDLLHERRSFQTQFRPVVDRYRQRRSHHPYHRSLKSSAPSSSSSDSSPSQSSSASRRTVPIRPEDALAQIMTPPLLEVPESYTHPEEPLPGSSRNPIVIEEDDDDDLICTRCKRYGHIQDDCDTNIRTFEHCEICEWKGKPQEDCKCVDFPNPAWVKRTQKAIEERDECEWQQQQQQQSGRDWDSTPTSTVIHCNRPSRLPTFTSSLGSLKDSGG